jgi:hypothetical protein
MARPDDEDEKPLDPSIDRLRRKLIRFMGINLGLIFLALMVVVGALVYKSYRTPPASAPASDIPMPAGQPASGDIVLPVGAKIASQSISGDRIAIDAELADGSRAIFVYDMAERRMVGRFALRTE